MVNPVEKQPPPLCPITTLSHTKPHTQNAPIAPSQSSALRNCFLLVAVLFLVHLALVGAYRASAPPFAYRKPAGYYKE